MILSIYVSGVFMSSAIYGYWCLVTDEPSPYEAAASAALAVFIWPLTLVFAIGTFFGMCFAKLLKGN